MDLREANLTNQMPTVPVTDPNALPAQITPENTLRGQRLGFGVTPGEVAGPAPIERVAPQSTVGAVQARFESALPQFQQQLRDEIEALSKRTSAMGRTGIAQFDKEGQLIAGRNQAAREALLGQLLFGETQADANRALTADQANQGASLSRENLAANIAQSNVDRTLDVDFARQAHLGNLQAREDALAREALGDEAMRLSLLQQGFANTPTGAVGQAAQALGGGAQQYGENAGILANQAGQFGSQALQAILQLYGQGAPASSSQGLMSNYNTNGTSA